MLDDELGGGEKRSVGVVDVQNKTVVKVVKTFPGGTPAPGVRTTLDVTYQKAATKALAGTGSKAAIVAVDVRTGEVRAVANRPYTGVPPALSGRYAPGSTFKIVTALAALRNGSTPSSTVSCPTTITSYGKVFKNYEKAPNRSMSLTEAFADSCNTAFIGLARSLPAGALASAAEDLGFNADQPLPWRPSGAPTRPRRTTPSSRRAPSARAGSRPARCRWPASPRRSRAGRTGSRGCSRTARTA